MMVHLNKNNKISLKLASKKLFLQKLFNIKR